MTTLALDGRFYRVSLAALPDAPKRARRFLKDQLTRWGLPSGDDTAESALLALSEMVTNAVTATGRDSGPVEPLPYETVATIEVRTAASCNGLTVEVWDNSPEMPVLTDASQDQEHGRGVFIMITLAHEWGCRPEVLPPATMPGKTVWVSFKWALPAVAPAPATVRPAIPAQRPELPALPRRAKQKTPAPTPTAEPDALSQWATGPDVLMRVYTALRASTRTALQTT
ncbi:ATP-binding protein [Actinospica durhamensis]|uniref:ATP-binding protein n=1 Tax=Actinospica durhamensis TaxID=1508375 RepID=A0A941IVF9_9ACTN|nr:ATP-binding protein [Actinospica durhamensis]MBR7839263.1 ATP-binding protein [Actinospica durhamensis]